MVISPTIIKKKKKKTLLPSNPLLTCHFPTSPLLFLPLQLKSHLPSPRTTNPQLYRPTNPQWTPQAPSYSKQPSPPPCPSPTQRRRLYPSQR